SYRRFPIPARLEAREVADFRSFLKQRHFGGLDLRDDQIEDPYFLLLLYRYLPDSRGNIILSATQEYERLLHLLDRASEEPDQLPGGDLTEWQKALTSVRDTLFPSAEK